MKRILALQSKFILAVAALVFTVLGTGVALAVSPHFVSVSAKVSDENLVVSFKEAGLGTNELIDYLATATAQVTYVCVNNGGANPSAANKTTIAEQVTEPGQFSSGKNGNVTASLTLKPDFPPTGFSCPNGQKLAIAEVVYTDVTLTDVTNTITTSITGTFDTGCLLPDVRGACPTP